MTRPSTLPDVHRWAMGLAASGRGPAADVTAADVIAADVMAGVARALGVPWDGPGHPVGVEVPDATAWVVLDAAREALVGPPERRRLGAHHTPPDLARCLVALALADLGPGVTVADPACGGGAFLVAAAEQLVAAGADPGRVVAEQLVGIDVDPLAAATTRAALRAWAAAHGAVAEAEVRVDDGLAARWAADVVVGNPPFLSPLGTATAGGAAASELRRSLGAPYADAAWLFLVRALDQIRPGGRVVLIQPESLLSARDAEPIRAAALAHLEGLWVAGERVFGGSVRVCAPVLRKVVAAGPVRRWQGRTVRRAPQAPRPAAGSWAALRPTSAPVVRRRAGGPLLGELATATAGFRAQFYGLAEAVVDGGGGARLVTSGLIDPGRDLWGERTARIGGRRFDAPTVELTGLGASLRAWTEARLVPKVVVATQTRVVEAAADPDGRFVPLTPVLAVVPHDPLDVWRIAAALTAPQVSAWALRRYGGSALSADAIKLSAKQVLMAPLPTDAEAWDDATDALRAGEVVSCGTILAAGDDRLLQWWKSRLPHPTPPKPGAATRPYAE